MGIIAKAMRKSQLEAAQLAAEELKPKTPEPAVRTDAAPPDVPPEPLPPASGPGPQLNRPPAAPEKMPPPPAAPELPGRDAAGSFKKPEPPAAKPAAVRPLAATLARTRGASEDPPPVSVAAAPEHMPAAPAAEAEPAAEAAAPQAADAAAGRAAPDLVSLSNPEGPEAELFKLLRTRILFPQSGQRPPRTILVTSALPEEGKSFVAANLAVNIARNVDEHVLLVDCDLRKPSIHARFGFNGVKGLSEYLSAGLALPGLLLKTGVAKLTLLPSGASPSNPSELISSSKMAGLINELKARYDDRYIILDSPPPMMAPETSAVAQWADGILVVVRYGTPMSLVEELVSHLDRDKIIGVVINRVHQREFQRYAYKKYYRSSRYYPALTRRTGSSR